MGLPVPAGGRVSTVAEELAAPLRDAVRRHVAGGGEQFLDQLVALADAAPLNAHVVRALLDEAAADQLEGVEAFLILKDLRRSLEHLID